MAKMSKIVPFRENFENLQALLARMAEDEEAVGFCGCLFKKENAEDPGTLVPVTFGVNRTHVALTAAILQRECLAPEGER